MVSNEITENISIINNMQRLEYNSFNPLLSRHIIPYVIEVVKNKRMKRATSFLLKIRIVLMKPFIHFTVFLPN